MDKNDRGFCVYVHCRKVDDSIFYVGQGRPARAMKLVQGGRSEQYKEIISNEDCYAKIIKDGLTKQEAECLEELTISHLISTGVKLSNVLNKPSSAKHLRREDYPFLDYCENTLGNLIWNEDRYAGNNKSRHIATKAGERAASLSKRSGYCLFRNIMAHRIVYALVHGECPADKQVNHINGIKHDNRKENLELVSPSENIVHAFRTGLAKSRKGEESPASVLKDGDVIMMYEYMRNNLSNEEIADIYDIEWKHVSLIRNGTRWKHLFKDYGYDIPQSSKVLTVTNEQITEALLLIEAGLINKDISIATGIEASTVSRIRSGKAFTSKLDRLKPNLI